jgi:hypothetical protein
MNDGSEVLFDYSETKLKLLKELLDERYKLVDGILKEQKRYFVKTNSNEILKSSDAATWGESQITYLNRHAQNLIWYSIPIKVSLPVNPTNFERLFKKYVWQEEDEVIQTAGVFIPKVNTFYDEHLQNRTNLHIEITNNQIDKVVVPVKIDSVGMNEIPFACQAIDFTEHYKTVENKLNHLIHLHMAFLAQYKTDKMFCIYNKNEKQSAATKLFEDLAKSGIVELKSADEIDAITEYVETHDVQPLFQF